MSRIAKSVAGLLLALSLSGCIDASLDVDLTSNTTASATLTQVMRSDSYVTMNVVDTIGGDTWLAGMKAVEDAEKAIVDTEADGKDASTIVVPPEPEPYYFVADSFCTHGGRMLERVDGGATCMDSSEGEFADIHLEQLDEQVSFTPEEDGTVRIAISTAQVLQAVTPQMDLTTESEDIVLAMFKDRKITITFSGDAVTETNMKLARDEKSASQSILILDLLTGKSEMPAEFYAVVRAP
ncbi:MAG: hypothetical protein P0Y65_17475 [Candidatus Devosia phytovorans]|uniref:Uncharacterized protein n=1 Tax=Candidatus Devosia phytovorans TaxID=3121372 RepID=A0AAJ5VSI6_9HYPH|nr:hypothetical protein [Devosia sp.]WEK03959.1 MAG: hypothetical protein P0Y65_17475 [Devosia sp.]